MIYSFHNWKHLITHLYINTYVLVFFKIGLYYTYLFVIFHYLKYIVNTVPFNVHGIHSSILKNIQYFNVGIDDHFFNQLPIFDSLLCLPGSPGPTHAAADIQQLDWGSKAPDVLTQVFAHQCWRSALHFSMKPLCQGSPKTTLRFDDSLERFTGLRKAAVLTVMVYDDGERMLIRLSKGKRHVGQSLTETSHKLPGYSSQWDLLGTCFTLPPTCVTTRAKYYQPGKLAESQCPWSSVLLVRRETCSTHVTGLSYSDSSSPRDQTGRAWPED